MLRNFKRQGSLTIKVENDNKEAILENCLSYDTADIIDTDEHSISVCFLFFIIFKYYLIQMI